MGCAPGARRSVCQWHPQRQGRWTRGVTSGAPDGEVSVDLAGFQPSLYVAAVSVRLLVPRRVRSSSELRGVLRVTEISLERSTTCRELERPHKRKEQQSAPIKHNPTGLAAVGSPRSRRGAAPLAWDWGTLTLTRLGASGRAPLPAGGRNTGRAHDAPCKGGDLERRLRAGSSELAPNLLSGCPRRGETVALPGSSRKPECKTLRGAALGWRGDAVAGR